MPPLAENELVQAEARLLARINEVGVAADTAWIICCGAFVVLMQLGFAMLEAGTVREHNVIATYAKNLVDFMLGSIVALAIGFFIAYGVHPLVLTADDVEDNRSFFFHLAFQATAATIVSGAMAERTSVFSYALLSVSVSTIARPSHAHSLWLLLRSQIHAA